MTSMRDRFCQHRCSARQRGIIFKLTFEQWCDLWLSSGHYEQRGCRRGQFVMARKRDRGAYAVGNVEIVPQEANHKEARPHQREAGWSGRSFKGSSNGRAKLDERKVRLIRASKDTKNALAKKYGVSWQVIDFAIKRKTWRHI